MSLDIRDETLLGRICVKPPYFALTDLVSDEPGSVHCTAPVQLPPGVEAPVSMAEAARHCAIAGLCAAATTAPDEDRRYYLAGRSTLERVSAGTAVACDSVAISARGALTSPRSASATVQLFAAGKLLFRLSIEYVVLSSDAFAKIFRHLADNSGAHGSPPNPYTVPLPLREPQITSDTGAATVYADTAHCVGHFPGHPAMPVAYLLTAEFELGARIARRRLGGRPVVPVVGDLLEARTLLPAERPIELRAHVVEDDDNTCTVEVTTSAGRDDEVRARFVYRPATGGPVAPTRP